MPKLTPQQQTDFDTWQQDQSQALPKSLKNILIESLVEEFNNDELIDLMCEKYKKEVVRKIQPERGYNYIAFCHPDDIPSSYHNWYYAPFHRLPRRVQIEYLLFFLSRTPDGKAVMPFLDVETKDWIESYVIPSKWHDGAYTQSLALVGRETLNDGYEQKLIFKTLDHLLYREFTEALRVGKSFDQALEIITKIYLNNLYD